MSKRLGKDGTLSDNTGTFGAPAWRAIKSFKDITLNLEPVNNIDTTDRFIDYKTELPASYKLSIEANTIWNKNTSQTAIRTAFLAGTFKEFAVLDRAPAFGGVGGGLGVRGEMLVKKFSLTFPLHGEQKLDVTIVPHGIHTASQGAQFYTDATATAGTADAAGTKRLGRIGTINYSGASVTRTGDIKLNLEWATTPGDDRELTFATEIPTQMMTSVEAELLWDPDVASVAIFRTAFTTHATLELKVLDGLIATNGTWGLHSDFAVKSFNHKLPLTERQSISVTLVPHGNATNQPTFITISA